MWLLHFLPLALLARAGEALGMLFYSFGVERRRVCLLNLARCLPELAASERLALARRHFRAVGRSLLERGILWWAPRSRIVQMVRLAGFEHLRALTGQPVILLAPHFVALDVGFARLACEIDVASIYANQKSAVMNRMLLAGRTRFGRQRLFSRQEGVRPALAALTEGVPFYYLPDQDYGPRDAIFVPFFGVPAATITGLSRLARLAGAQVVPCITRMLPRGEGYELTCYPAWKDFPTEDVGADTRRMNAFVEERVREMPEQYFWTHKRFKTRPEGEPKWY
jgi:KDO2-lipid IV(A) lauroyltransferase